MLTGQNLILTFSEVSALLEGAAFMTPNQLSDVLVPRFSLCLNLQDGFKKKNKKKKRKEEKKKYSMAHCMVVPQLRQRIAEMRGLRAMRVHWCICKWPFRVLGNNIPEPEGLSCNGSERVDTRRAERQHHLHKRIVVRQALASPTVVLPACPHGLDGVTTERKTKKRGHCVAEL